jgi:hypothetical protein
MNNQLGIPKGALVAIGDLLDNCAKVKPGQEVLILAHIDGLYGGDNVVDQEAMSWIQAGVQARGANASMLWIDEPGKIHAWRFPPIAKAAIGVCDILINNSFDIVTEENVEYRDWINENKIHLVRNFATTAPLLCSTWAQTPYELVSEIRYQASTAFKAGLPWKLTDENGTSLEGVVAPSINPAFPSYSVRRDIGYYYPWPEWVHPPVIMKQVNGVFIFDCMLSWWSRYIGISPYFKKPIRLDIKNSRITKFSGGEEAEALKRFLASMKERLGDVVYDFNTLHFGVHPQAFIGEHQCPSLLYRRMIEHSQSNNMHVHIGAPSDGTPSGSKSYPYWTHITGDIRNSTFVVGDTVVCDKGHLTALDSPAVLAIAAKYPGRPGLKPEPRSY